MDVVNELLDAIEIIVDKKVRENTAQIYPGICKSVSGNSCVMSINGKDNTIQFYGSIPTVGAIYRVFVPDGNMSMAFAITGNDDRKGLHYSNPNFLDNWYFGNPVNQRRQTEYTEIGYTIDRWKLPTTHKVSVQDSDIKITCNSSAGANFCFQQLVENLEVGKQYTLSALITENTTTKGVSLRHGNSGPGTITGVGVYSFTFVADSVDLTSGVGMQFNSKADDNDNYIVLKAIKLELGSQQTLAHQDTDGNWVLNEIPDYGEQLTRCQRYFVNFNPNKANYFAMPVAVASDATNAYSAVTLPVAMRAQPTVSYGGKIALSQTGDVQVTGIQVSGNTFAGNYLQLKYSVADGLTANSTYRVQGYNDPTSYIWLSADL